MQIGYNNDVQYRGKTFHIQTEDHGEKMASIETQIFHAGAIYDTSIVSYKKIIAKIPEGDDRVKKIRTMMQANHKSLYNKLLAGEYDKFAGLEPLKEGEEVELDELIPSQERVPTAALEFEKGERPFPEQDGEGEHVSLADIQKKLKEDQQAAEKAAEKATEKATEKSALEGASSATMMLDEDKLIEKPSKSAPISSTAALRAKFKNRVGTNSKILVPDFATSGIRAYRGCGECKEDFAITELVEIFLAG